MSVSELDYNTAHFAKAVPFAVFVKRTCRCGVCKEENAEYDMVIEGLDGTRSVITHVCHSCMTSILTEGKGRPSQVR